MKQQSCGNVFIVNDGETYGAGIASEVERTARHEDVAVLANFAFDVAATRFRALAARVKRASSDCFFFGGITMNRALEVTRDVAAAVPGIKMFYPDGCAEAFFTERIPEGLQRRVFITNPTLDQDAYPPSAQDFFDTFSTLYGKDPEPYAMYGYEAMNVVLDSIERAGSEVTATSEGRQAVVDAFFDTKDRQSVLGTYDIDAFGDTTLSDYGAYAVARGKLVFKDVLHAVVAPPTDTPQIDESVTRALTSPLEGTWRGGKVTLANLTSELTEEDARFVLNENGASEYMVTSLRLSGDRWQVSVSADGGPDLPAQAGLFSIKGNLIHMAEPAGAKYVYRYSLDGDTLRIHLVDSDAPPGDDIFQYAHYGQPFVKVE
jgi:hypothetical protein